MESISVSFEFPLHSVGEGQGEGVIIRARQSPELARKLRKTSTIPERLIWRVLRDNCIHGLKFRRQYPIGNYIVDFVCLEKRVVIEIDGGQHAREKDIDSVRTQWLESGGFRMIRFWNNEVHNEMDAVKKVLWQEFQDKPPSP